MIFITSNIYGISFFILFLVSLLLFRDSYNVLIKKKNVILLNERVFLYLMEMILGKKKYRTFRNGYIIQSRKFDGINFLISGILVLVMSILSLSVWIKNW